jgi:type IX secretion system PorP/SprF family membrane protein
MKQCIYSLIFTVTLSFSVHAQSGIKLTDYYHNPIQYNPAYVGVSNGYFVKGTYTSQWLGFDDAPVTQTLDVQRRFSNNRYAAGLSILNDDFGAVKNFNIEANFGLHLRANENTGFVLGLKAGLNNFSIDYNRLNIYDPTEFVYSNGNLGETKPIIGAGFFFYGREWFFGMSVPNIISHRLEDELNRDIYNKIPHFYSTLGFDYNISADLLLKTQALIQMVEGAPFSTLFTTRAQYRNKIGLGLQYQSEALYGAFINVRFRSEFTLTYGYDVAVSDLSQYSNGNHYFGLSYKFGQPDKCDCEDDINNEDRLYITR